MSILGLLMFQLSMYMSAIRVAIIHSETDEFIEVQIIFKSIIGPMLSSLTSAVLYFYQF
jgi:hypothetical protein